VFFCPVLEIKKFGHPKVKTECTVSLRGDVEAVAMKQIRYELYQKRRRSSCTEANMQTKKLV